MNMVLRGLQAADARSLFFAAMGVLLLAMTPHGILSGNEEQYLAEAFRTVIARYPEKLEQVSKVVAERQAEIESKRGVRNIDEILAVSDEILIDRGDLSREVPLENLPFLQKAIIRKANIAKIADRTNLIKNNIYNA